MIYKIFRVLMTWALKFYFKRIDIHGLDHIPKNAPVIFACNHPSSFMEAVLLACFQPRELHFLVRGDVFKMKWLRGLLRVTNQIPIFRFKDGYSNLKQNTKTFSKAYEILSENGAIIIYPEGSTILTKTLRPLKKGVAKLALGTLETYDLDHLYVVPVGINYFDVLSWRSDVTIQIGKPVDATKYKSAYEEKAQPAMLDLTQEIYESMKPLVISFDDYEFGHDSLLLEGLHKDRRTGFPNNSFFTIQKDIADSFNEHPHSVASESVPHSIYRTKVDDGRRLVHLIKFVILGLISIPVLILFLPIWMLAERIVTKNRMDIEFVAPTKLAILIVLTTAITLILTLLGVMISIRSLWVVPLVILLSYWALSKSKDSWDVLRSPVSQET